MVARLFADYTIQKPKLSSPFISLQYTSKTFQTFKRLQFYSKMNSEISYLASERNLINTQAKIILPNESLNDQRQDNRRSMIAKFSISTKIISTEMDF